MEGKRWRSRRSAGAGSTNPSVQPRAGPSDDDDVDGSDGGDVVMRVSVLVGREAGARGGGRGATARLNLTACVCWTLRNATARGVGRRCTQSLSPPGCSTSQARRVESRQGGNTKRRKTFFSCERAPAAAIASPTFRSFLTFSSLTQPCRRERPSPRLPLSAHSRHYRPRPAPDAAYLPRLPDLRLPSFRRFLRPPSSRAMDRVSGTSRGGCPATHAAGEEGRKAWQARSGLGTRSPRLGFFARRA